jgi:hypothetical protein
MEEGQWAAMGMVAVVAVEWVVQEVLHLLSIKLALVVLVLLAQLDPLLLQSPRAAMEETEVPITMVQMARPIRATVVKVQLPFHLMVLPVEPVVLVA